MTTQERLQKELDALEDALMNVCDENTMEMIYEYTNKSIELESHCNQ